MAGYNYCTISAMLPGKAVGQVCWAIARVIAMVQSAESMVKLVKNAVF
jgi:hypothetical protein